MKDKQKQIEEMTRSCTDCMHYEICSLWTTTDLDEDEAYKYCFGRYRPKIPENAVVITKEEYEQYEKCKDLLTEYINGEIISENVFCQQVEDIKQIRKDMLSKMMRDVSEDTLTISTRDYGSIEVVPLDRISEICENILRGDK